MLPFTVNPTQSLGFESWSHLRKLSEIHFKVEILTLSLTLIGETTACLYLTPMQPPAHSIANTFIKNHNKFGGGKINMFKFNVQRNIFWVSRPIKPSFWQGGTFAVQVYSFKHFIPTPTLWRPQTRNDRNTLNRIIPMICCTIYVNVTLSVKN